MSTALPVSRHQSNLVGASLGRLTTRERQILDAMLRPETVKETARSLKLSPATVQVHRGRVLAKMGVTSTVELMRLFIDERQPADRGAGRGEGARDSTAGKGGGTPNIAYLAYSPTMDPGAVNVCMLWSAARLREAIVIVPEGRNVDGVSSVVQQPLDSAIAFALLTALRTQSRLVISGDPSVWDEAWGPLPGTLAS